MLQSYTPKMGKKGKFCHFFTTITKEKDYESEMELHPASPTYKNEYSTGITMYPHKHCCLRGCHPRRSGRIGKLTRDAQQLTGEC